MLFLSAVGMGAMIGLVYDFFRVLRRVLKHPNWAVQLEDILFWLVATLGMFYFILRQNSGAVPMFSVMAVFCGAVIYFATLSRLVLVVFVKLASIIKIVLAKICYIIALPFTFARKLARPIHKKLKQTKTKAKRSWHIIRNKV